MTTRKAQLVEIYGARLTPGVRPMESGPARRLLVAASGKAPADLAPDVPESRALDGLVALSGGLPALLRSAGRMCASRSPVATLQFFETHRRSQRLPRTMARADGYQIDAARGNVFLALESQVHTYSPRWKKKPCPLGDTHLPAG